MWVERERVIAELERLSDEGTRLARKRWDASRNADGNAVRMPDAMQDQSRADQTRQEKNLMSKPDGFNLSGCETPKTPDDDHKGHRDSVFAEAVRGVWEYYIETIPRNPKLYTFTAKRKAMGIARLRDLVTRSGSIEQGVGLMRLCVDRLKQSAFHNGKNDQQKKYLDWEILFRSTEQLEKWLDDERWADTKGVA